MTLGPVPEAEPVGMTGEGGAGSSHGNADTWLAVDRPQLYLWAPMASQPRL